ncbi:sulfurtransferase TusA family protein [Paractinoplanes maris]|uniref:sulfurtransferase TusA family protein n=1 Tax=Paractinoplanes maris TaxID=1734446 RepID=UPI00202238F5|nr:sulfurtransferase TusA family protein [Actinoplanes maris]
MDLLLDCRGLKCPLPIIRLAQRIGEVPVGGVVRVLADDPAAANDIAAWCRMKHQELVGSPGPDTFDVRRLS